MPNFVPLLARNEALNKWLSDNPLIVTVIAAVLAAVLIVSGIRGIQSGKAGDKYGFQYTGGTATAINVIRIAGGIIFVFIALYGLTRVLS